VRAQSPLTLCMGDIIFIKPASLVFLLPHPCGSLAQSPLPWSSCSHILMGLWHKAHFLGLLVAKPWWVFGPLSLHVVIKPVLIRIGLVLSSALLGLHSSKDVASRFTHHTFMLRAHTHTNIWFVKYSHTYLILCAQHHW
jgi:hypothetical protein